MARSRKNTRAVGDRFEQIVFAYFKDQISGGLFVSPEPCCHVFWKKAYFSRDRQKDIVFDVAIEITLPDSKDPSVYWIIECKDYGHPVSVGLVEEFFAKLQQVAPANVKGVMASTNNFEAGALEFARAKGIGLLRFFGNDHFKWDLVRSPSVSQNMGAAEENYPEIYRGLTVSDYQSCYFDMYFTIGQLLTNSLYVFFAELTNQVIAGDSSLAGLALMPPLDRRQVEFIERQAIEALTSTILVKTHYSRGEVSLRRICDWQTAERGLTAHLEVERSGTAVSPDTLGTIRFEPLEITVFKDSNEGRSRFTTAHELGHHFLGHSKYLRKELYSESDAESPLEVVSSLGLRDIKAMEWQANHFASCLLLPRGPLVAHFFKVLKELGLHRTGGGYLYVDDQTCNINSFFTVTGDLMHHFHVSRTAIEVRLSELGLLRRSRTLIPMRSLFD